MSAIISPDCELVAHVGQDGRLRVYECLSGKLKVEFVGREHLASPCAALAWLWQAEGHTSDWRKRRRKEEPPSLVLGSTDGSITEFSVARNASAHHPLHSSGITALGFHPQCGLISALESHELVQYSEGFAPKEKWRSGKFRVNALKISRDGKSLFTGSKMIKWWCLETKKLVKAFSACQGPIKALEIVNDDLVLAAATGESSLTVWSLDRTNEETSATPKATLSLQDDAEHISTLSSSLQFSQDAQSSNGNLEPLVATVTRSGQVQIHRVTLNSQKSRPIKPSLTLLVSSEEAKEIPILISCFVSASCASILYGTWVYPVCERVELKFEEKVQCLVRGEKKIRERREELAGGRGWGVVGEDAEYVQAHTPNQKRSRTNSSGSQIPLKDRLENLSISQDQNQGQKSMIRKNLTQLLIQGLNSKDRSILNDVLFTKDENLVRNTVAKLPVQAIAPLLREVASLFAGKTFSSKRGVLWLETLLSQHSAHFLSLPDCSEHFSPILHQIDAKLQLLPEIGRLKGRVALVTGQISKTIEENNENEDEGVLVYQDPDSSEEDADIQEEDLQISSDENWEELSNTSNEEINEDGLSDNDESM